MTSMSAPRAKSTAKGPGRPRSERAHRAILRAALELLLEQGFAEMSVEGVASRAGVGKATIYRRWPAKADLVAEAVGRMSHKALDPVDTGSVRGDLMALAEQAFKTEEADEVTEIMLKLMVERARHPELQEAFLRRVVHPRRRLMADILQRGIDRGELRPDIDVDLLVDLLMGVVLYRSMLAARHAPVLDRGALERAMDMVFEGVAAPRRAQRSSHLHSGTKSR
ncbi:MAG TPA: TetR/AcrR family transcriptional regulator [Actinomycetes bacterium]|jgi:AcrR family transcriptional regulator|nr:TetR/AcrR family transcriptional regulator [Actinomycetes bacterium]